MTDKELAELALKEQEEKAQIIIDTAVQRVREIGFGVVADGTVYGNGVWIDRLRVRRVEVS